MGYSFVGRFEPDNEPDDEPDYSGTCAQDVEIDEIEVNGVTFAINIHATFTHDGNNWIADEVFIAGYENLRFENETKQIEAFIKLHDEPQYEWMVLAAEKWADRNLMPEDYQ